MRRALAVLGLVLGGSWVFLGLTGAGSSGEGDLLQALLGAGLVLWSWSALKKPRAGAEHRAPGMAIDAERAVERTQLQAAAAQLQTSARYEDRISDRFRTLAGAAYGSEALWQANIEAIQQLCGTEGMVDVSLSEVLTVGVQAMESADLYGESEDPSLISYDMLWHFLAGDLTFSNGVPINGVMSVSQFYKVGGEVLNWTRPEQYDRLKAANDATDPEVDRWKAIAFLEKRIRTDGRFSSIGDLGLSPWS